MTEDCPKAGGVLWVSCVDHEARPVAHGKSAGDPILQRVLVKEIPRRTSMGANVRQWGRRCQTIFKVVGWILNHMKSFVPPQINIARTCPACCRCQSKSNEREMSYQVKPTRLSESVIAVFQDNESVGDSHDKNYSYTTLLQGQKRTRYCQYEQE
jgi:hypothetical protein